VRQIPPAKLRCRKTAIGHSAGHRGTSGSKKKEAGYPSATIYHIMHRLSGKVHLSAPDCRKTAIGFRPPSRHLGSKKEG